jgi:hypothetical protein
MISSYRLGDLVLLNLSDDEKNTLFEDNPNSIGSKYIIEKNKNENQNNIDLITRIVTEHIKENNYIFPDDISESIVIHVRLGDVVAGYYCHEMGKRPLEIEKIKNSINEQTGKKYIIGNCFFARTSSTNYDECIYESNEYLNNILIELNAEHFDSKNADMDLCLAVKSKLFVQGRGFFSKLIVEIRKKLGLPNIEIETHV